MSDRSTLFERRLEMLFLIYKIRKTSVPALADYFSVSRNTAYRDIECLSRYAPIYTRNGMYGGVFILNGSQNNLRLHLSMDEENLIRRLAESAYPRDARLLRNILHKYSMPPTDV